MRLTCTQAVSEESGDPLIIANYTVTDPGKRGWRLTISYTNDEGRNTETFTGRGTTKASQTFYGIFGPGIKPNCKGSIKAR